MTREAFACKRGFLKFFERREIEKSQGEGDSAHSTKWGSPSQTRKRQENAIEIDEF